MVRRLLLSLLFAVLPLSAVACNRGDSAAAPSEQTLAKLTVDQVAERLAAKDGKTFVFDNNPKRSWVEGHVPGAKWLDEDQVTADALPADKSATLIFYCHNET